ncbi:MAG: hypothetical protein ACTSUO_00125 [Candidatus Thorarchaeota archaeon]
MKRFVYQGEICIDKKTGEIYLICRIPAYYDARLRRTVSVISAVNLRTGYAQGSAFSSIVYGRGISTAEKLFDEPENIEIFKSGKLLISVREEPPNEVRLRKE